MNGVESKIVKYLEGSDKRFIIPVYQRNYSWKEENCRQLYDDLIKLSVNESNMHFFGSIVSVHNDTSGQLLIIDGQQRITTISLLLLAMYKILKEKSVISDNVHLKEKIYEEYLIDKYDMSEKKMKLKAGNNDRVAFENLFDDDVDSYIKDSDITINFKYFYNRILKEEISIDELYDAICKLMVINITVGEGDNPQLIFESLNSTGVDLTEGDKIRNFVLMGQSIEKQNEYYKYYWKKIEEFTNNNENSKGVSLFVRDYLSIKMQSTPAMDKIYPVFKTYVNNEQITIEAILKDLLTYAKLYRILLKAEFHNKSINNVLERLNYLDATVSRPFLLEVFKLNSNGELLENDIKEILTIVEDYLFRRNICEVPTNALNKIFLNLNKDVFKLEKNYDNYVDKLSYIITSKKESGRFPDDAEFSISLSEKQIYNMRGRYKKYLFERFENNGTLETNDILKHLEDGTYTIEHIMPQTPTKDWEESMENFDEVHEKWLHRLANLTVTAYNGPYSNHTFLEKRDDKNGYANSAIKMNLEIAKKDKWTLEELEERNQYMVEQAKDIWTYPITSFKPVEKPLDTYTLDDDIDFTGTQIVKFSFKGNEKIVSTWTEMYTSVVKDLNLKDSSVLTKLVNSPDGVYDLKRHVSDSDTAFKNPTLISDNVFLWTGNNTETKINSLRKFFEMYNEENQDLVFYLKEVARSNNSDAERYVLRKKYWTYSLPMIQNAHGEGKSFYNVHPSTSNWISGFIGISGFCINCIANFNGARVEMYLGKSDLLENKKAFDILFQQKEKIEGKFGAKLEWNRADENKTSSIVYRLDGVSLKNEADWETMAKFHAEYSKRIYDVIVPCLNTIR